jgi:prephenate dehydrogenase
MSGTAAEDGFPEGREAIHLAGARVAIVGLGLMGGSLALALRGHCRELLGIDPDPQVVDLALSERIVDRASLDPAALLPQADLVILAAPVRAILHLLADLPALHPGSPLVMDLGSTKTEILAAMQTLPVRFDVLGGHPMCGKEKSSLAEAEARIYTGAAFALVALERTSLAGRTLAEELVHAAGARPLWLAAAEHDRWVAATSHLPYLVAGALAACTPPEVAPLVGPGFRSTARVAGTSPSMMLDVITTNRAAILDALQRFRGQIDALEACLANMDLDALHASLVRGAQSYQALTGNVPAPVKPSPPEKE